MKYKCFLIYRMESTGKPEQVHISEETCSFLGDAYILEEGEEVFGRRTYFVVSRRKNSKTPYSSSLNPIPQINNRDPSFDAFMNRAGISHSVANMTSVQPTVPPTSPAAPISSSLNPSPVLSIRPKLTSFSLKVRKKLSNNQQDPEKGQNSEKIVTREHPKIVITAKSLPDSLDSDNEDSNCCKSINDNPTENLEIGNEKENKMITCATKFKSWKVPKFIKRFEEIKKSDLGNFKVKLPDEEQQNVDQNGYQQLPVVIEAPRPNLNIVEISQQKTQNLAPILVHTPAVTKSSEESCSPGQHSMFDDIIDIRSYISQSRSDISPFGRSGSYRSQCGRSVGTGDTSPQGRPRSSTLATRNDGSCERNNIGNWPDGLSICPSTSSRKDSGIKSNSRRSSIQQQIYALNHSAVSQHGVSGYFTNSITSLTNQQECHLQQMSIIIKPNEIVPDPLAACLQQLRKQSDLQLIRCVRDNAKSQRSYLVKPPVNRFSLFFKSKQIEREFRSKAHRFGIENETEGPPTLATPRYNTYIDIFVGTIIYLTISCSLFLMAPSVVSPLFQVWASIFVLFTAINFFALFLFTRQMCRHYPIKSQTQLSSKSDLCADRIFEAISNWYPWHICLGILMSLPIILIVIHFIILDLQHLKSFEYFYGFLIFMCIVHFCNFTQLNCWMRNILALLAAICFICIVVDHLKINTKQNGNNNDKNTEWYQHYHTEIYLDLILILLLVWFANREFEIGYRLAFYGNAVANEDKIRVQNMKNQADMLLHNIIPKHVAEQLKNTAKYSENHHNVAIIFASIVNFNEMYDESYLGGKEYLRVLNELIGDFDELLTRPEFRCVEKIKTIGSTFMAASGLDPSNRGDNNEHIYALMEFSLAMQSVVYEFNKDLLEFNLILRIGFNIGDVTAGVIGTSKLHYDIWGDAVNVASRMDSTGVAGRIQIGEDCLEYLKDKYEFESRGKVYVKGKDHMEVFLYKDKKRDIVDSE